MGRKKTTKAALQAINHYQDQLKHFEKVIWVKQNVPVENQGDHISSKSLDYFEGWITGLLVATEDVIHTQGCWHGFRYIDASGGPLIASGGYITEEVEYRDFRVKHFIS